MNAVIGGLLGMAAVVAVLGLIWLFLWVDTRCEGAGPVVLLLVAGAVLGALTGVAIQ